MRMLVWFRDKNGADEPRDPGRRQLLMRILTAVAVPPLLGVASTVSAQHTTVTTTTTTTYPTYPAYPSPYVTTPSGVYVPGAPVYGPYGVTGQARRVSRRTARRTSRRHEAWD
jgi:hypothetical protein